MSEFNQQRRLSARAVGMRRSEIRMLFDAAARAGGHVIRLEVVGPGFATPVHGLDGTRS